ncbi:bacteriocin [Rodentibacter pneumotropicus]|uniref:KilA-N domain-containing protein n=1 Tax=Rodentibacter pneumotropicus TaxID=758 RepID=A0AAW5LAD2_9PAST|nr:P22AR C-terminal domain-containing protein [Rodentibacter pneumotropicus]MCQ9121003.1 KilA-N domain-containing protein [Rodentibacter pneumotropicus]OOF69169.1 bacteriocin [Rodentibacter pneumotropicus]
MSNLTILNTSIRTLDNLFCLNDLHKASGSAKNKQPAFFIRNEQTKDLISEIDSENSHSANSQTAIKSINGGLNRGTYACEELVLAYATWISPKFHLVVLRAFLAMHRNEPKQLALPEPEKKFTFEFTEYELEQLVWLWCGHKQMNVLLGDMVDPLDAIGSRFTGIVISHHHEYQRQYKTTLPTIQRLIMPFRQSDRLNWTRAINLIKQ